MKGLLENTRTTEIIYLQNADIRSNITIQKKKRNQPPLYHLGLGMKISIEFT